MTISPEQIALAAYSACPIREDESVRDHEFRVARTAQMMSLAIASDETTIMRALADVSEIQHFRATIVSVRSESHTRRTIIETWNEKNAHDGRVAKDEDGNDLPPGHEIIRTPPRFDDSLDGLICRELTKQAVNLIGHEVIATKKIESFTPKGGSTRKVRVLVALRDLGPDKRFRVNYRTTKSGKEIPDEAVLKE